MQLTKRQKDIIYALMSDEFMSAFRIAQKLQISEKTVRVDIAQINSAQKDAVIQSYKGKGYKLIDPAMLNQSEVQHFTGEKRQFSILTSILSKVKINYYELADDFFISESTLDKDITAINKMISKRYEDISIKRKNNQLMLEGSEETKRSIFVYFLLKEFEEYNYNFDHFSSYFRECNLMELKQQVIEYIKEEDIQIKDTEIVSLILHLAITIERVKNENNILKSAFMTQKVIDHRSEKLCDKLEACNQVTLSQWERHYIDSLFIGKPKINSDSGIESVDYSEFLRKSLEEIYRSYHIDLREDETFKRKLLIHLVDLCYRVKTRQFIDNPLVGDIKASFPLVYDISVYISIQIQKYFSIKIHEDEIGYISLHFVASIEANNSSKKKIMIIDPNGAAVSGFIKNKVQQYFKDSIEIIGTYSLFQMKELKKQKVDLAITTVPLNQTFSFPVYQCSNLINNQELHKIKQLLTTQEFGKLEARLDLLKQFNRKLFFPLLEYRKSEEVIQYVCDQMVKEGYCSEQYVDGVMEREAIAATSFGNYIAIPHPVKMDAYKNGISVATLKHNVMWGEHKVRVVFLFSLTRESPNLTLFYEALVKYLDDESKIKNIIKCTDFNVFIDTFFN